MSAEALKHLQALGFSEYEGKAYIGLLQRGPLTGYQLAKASGIPRPNIYSVLDRLQKRGAVVPIEVKGGVKYRALPSKEMLARLSRSVEAHLDKASRALGEMKAAAPAEQVWNIQGYESVMVKAEALVEKAQRNLWVGIWTEESRHLSDAFARAVARGVKPTILCIQGCAVECGYCRGHIYRYPLATGARTRWLVLAADDEELLVGQVFPDGGATAAVTSLEVLVAVGTQYLQNAIAAGEIVRSLGERLPELVDAKALEALGGASLATAEESWFDHFLSAVREVQK